jgi:phytoene synthase
LRPAFDALMAIDDVMAEIVATTSQPALGAIRLAWWREALERLDHSSPPPEPRLEAVTAELLPRGVKGSEIAGIAAGWSALLDEQPDLALIATRGEALFAAGARLLEQEDPRLAEAARQFALGDAARRGWIAAPPRRAVSHRFAPRLRPLTALAKLAGRDALEPEATPARALALLRHRLTGRV